LLFQSGDRLQEDGLGFVDLPLSALD